MAELAATAVEDVDGATLEGGGQLLRVAVALGVGLGKDVRVKNIRAARSKPGLRPQHVASLRVAAAVGGVSVAGGVGAVEITVCGSKATDINQDVFEADAGTAGSTTLMLQASLPVCLLRRPTLTTRLRLKGGTNVPFSPGLDHARLVLAPNLKLMGVNLDVTCVKRGFMPEGGGTLEATISSDGIKPIVLDATEASPERIDGVVFGRGDENGGNRLRAALSSSLSRAFPGCLVIVRVEWAPSVKKSRGTLGAQLALTTSSGATIGADFLDGSKRPHIEALCTKLVAALKERHTRAGGGVDDQTADQLALCMAFASGPSRLRLPKPSCRHLETVMHFASRFTGATYKLEGEGESVVLTCTPKT
ncbi:unnamed protein product [Pelagomonas calceolata]|uniref:RNA 3'-terminal phosphate cyclase domain-containing protein n=1 Tax=Pelagomonas calceolata TaxID=35677 RepID=A0A7S4A7W5_9STRA|nr:unnamed protein product [Pelagomonas calceolata]|mmetsp:Transcript_8591/g.26856  ORF Transcript_8591/g.26856 Transcript_8591/m.26856 type:complete len:363 (+) Transcript_8591:206-1294(+)